MGIAVHRLRARPDTVTIVVGLGLLGNAIAKRIAFLGEPVDVTGYRDFSWNSSESILGEIQKAIRTADRENMEVIWSAGRSGFSGSNRDMEEEFNLFSNVVDCLHREYGKRFTLNLLSSAGGVYEDRRNVTDVGHIAPLRPYGFWKIQQEYFLTDRGVSNRIYRIASVYGATSSKERQGLIDVLIRNARSDANTLVYVSPNTLRDYILNTDVARIICEDIIHNNRPTVQILGSGRGTSVSMLINMISRVIRRRVKATYVPIKDDSRDILFSREVLPRASRITSLEEGILLGSRGYLKNEYFVY